MKGYTQIYVNKKNEKKKKSNNNSPINKSKEYSSNSNSNCKTNKNLPSSKLTKRNASVITFSDLKMKNSHEIDFKRLNKVDNNIFPEKNQEPKKTIKKVNINNKKDYVLELRQKRIKYNKNEKEPRNNEISLNLINDIKKVNINNYNNNKFKDEEKANIKENINIIKIKEKNGILKIQNYKSKKNSKERNDNIKRKNINLFDSSNSSIIKANEENNNYIIDINNLSDDSFFSSSTKKTINRNNYKNNSKINGKENKNKNKSDINNISAPTIKSFKIKKSIENNNYKNKKKVNKKKDSYQISKSNNINNSNNNNNNTYDLILNSNEISIESEGPNNIIIETKFNKSNNAYANEDIDLTKESKENMLSKEEILYYTHIIFLNNSTYVKNQQKYMMSKTNFLNIIKSLNFNF